MFEKYSNKYLTEKLNRKEQNLADLLADDVSDYLGDTMDFDEFSSMDQEEKEDVVNNALMKLSDKYYNDGDFDKDLDKLMNRKYKEVTSYIASQLSEGIEIINEARGAKSTEFSKPGKDGDIYFSKREGNAVAVRQGDLLQSIYVYDGEVKLGKIQKTDKRWENMGEPSEKLLVDLKLKNVGGLNTKATQTEDGKLIYAFLSESVNEAKSKYQGDPQLFKGDTLNLLADKWEVIETDYKPNKVFKDPFTFTGTDYKQSRAVTKITNKDAVGYKVRTVGRLPMYGFLYQYIGSINGELYTKLAIKGVPQNESVVNEAKYRIYMNSDADAPNEVDYEEYFGDGNKAAMIKKAKELAKDGTNQYGDPIKIAVTAEDDINDVVWTNESVNEGKVDWDGIAKEVADKLKGGYWPWAIKKGVKNITPEDIGSVLIAGGYTTNSGIEQNIGGIMDKVLALVKESVNEAKDEDYLKTLANSDYFAKGYETLFGLQSSIKRILGDREISPDESDVLDAINWLKDGLGNGDPRKTSLGKKLLKMKWVTESEVNERLDFNKVFKSAKRKGLLLHYYGNTLPVKPIKKFLNANENEILIIDPNDIDTNKDLLNIYEYLEKNFVQTNSVDLGDNDLFFDSNLMVCKYIEYGLSTYAVTDNSELNESVNEGQFSWMTHDSEAQIGSEATNRIHVYMFDNEGNRWEEKRYEGYGEFGGKDYYDLLARMNGYTEEDLKDKALLKKLRVVGKPEMRQIGIALAFDEKGVKPRNGKKVLYPALVTNPRYNWKRHNFEVEADSDPNQSWDAGDEYDDDDYGYYDESTNESWMIPRFESFVNENENRVYGMFTDDQGKPTKLDKELLDIALKGLPSNIVKNIDAVEANGYGKSSAISPPTVSNKGQSRGEIEYHMIGIGLLKPMGKNKITAITLGLRKRTSGPGTGYLFMKVAPDWRHNLGPDAEGAIEFWDDPVSFLQKLYNEKFKNWF